jgi:hypothetical protein
VATIDRRRNGSGKVTWRVRWREGGIRLDSETCDFEDDALDFAALVRLAGERRPEGYPQGCRGRRLLPIQEPDSEPQFSSRTLSEVFEEYLATSVDAEPRTVAEYRRDFRAHVQTVVVLLPGGEAVGPLGGLPMDECADAGLWQARGGLHRLAAALPWEERSTASGPGTGASAAVCLASPAGSFAPAGPGRRAPPGRPGPASAGGADAAAPRPRAAASATRRPSMPPSVPAAPSSQADEHQIEHPYRYELAILPLPGQKRRRTCRSVAYAPFRNPAGDGGQLREH